MGGTGGHNHASDFAIAEVVVWPRGLTSDEMHRASNHIMHRMGLRPAAYPADLNAWYCPGAFDLVSNTWLDCSGNGNTATLSGTGLTESLSADHGAANDVLALSGTTSSVIDFGPVISSSFTVCSATRYTGGTERRILQGGTNWLHGHHGGKAGVAMYDNQWKTSDLVGNVSPNTDWVVMCGSNDWAQLMLANGVDVGTANPVLYLPGVNCHPWISPEGQITGEWDHAHSRWAWRHASGANRYSVLSLQACKDLCNSIADCSIVSYESNAGACFLRKSSSTLDSANCPSSVHDHYYYPRPNTNQAGVSLAVNVVQPWQSAGETSDFEIAEVVVWPRGLTIEEMHSVSAHIMTRMGMSPPPLPPSPPSPPVEFGSG